MKRDEEDRIAAGLRRNFEGIREDLARRHAPPLTARKMSAPRVRATVSGWLLLGAVAIVVAAIGVRAGLVPLRANVPASGGAPAGSATMGRELQRVTLPGTTHQLAYDSARNAIWFVAQQSDSSYALFRDDVATGVLSHWSLPVADYSGTLTRAAVAPDGSIWVMAGYELARFDPANGTFASQTFTLEAAGALPDATNPAASSPGTWFSALAFDSSGDAVLARHNVPYLSKFNGQLALDATVPLPAGFAGPAGLAYSSGDLVVLRWGGGGICVLGASGQQISTQAVSGSRLSSRNGLILVVGSSSSTTGAQWITATGTSSTQVAAAAATNLLQSPSDQAAIGPDGSAVIWLNSATKLVRLSSNGSLGSSLQLATVNTTITNPSGVQVQIHSTPVVTSLVVDNANTVWYLDGIMSWWRSRSEAAGLGE